MSRESKGLYLADSVSALNKVVFKGIDKLNDFPVRTCCRMASECFCRGTDSLAEGDDEVAYVLYMRYMEMISMIRSRSEYRSDSRQYDSLMSVDKFNQSIIMCEKLQAKLTERYKLQRGEEKGSTGVGKKQEATEKQETSDQHSVLSRNGTLGISDVSRSIHRRSNGALDELKSDQTNGLSPPEDSTEITSTELLSLLQQKCSSVLIIDVRPADHFAASWLTLGRVINVPGDLLVPGVTADVIERSLPEPARCQFARRGSFDLLVTCDWSGGGQHLQVLGAALRHWDVNTAYRGGLRLRELVGGYWMWLTAYPMLTTNPHVKPPALQSPESYDATSAASAPLSDVKYPCLYPVTAVESTNKDSPAQPKASATSRTDLAATTSSRPGAQPRSNIVANNPCLPSRTLKPNLKPALKPALKPSLKQSTSSGAVDDSAKQQQNENMPDQQQPGRKGLVNELRSMKIDRERWHEEQRKLRDENESLKRQLMASKKDTSADSLVDKDKTPASTTDTSDTKHQQPASEGLRDALPDTVLRHLAPESNHTASHRHSAKTEDQSSTVRDGVNVDQSGQTKSSEQTSTGSGLGGVHSVPLSSLSAVTGSSLSPSLVSAPVSVSAKGGSGSCAEASERRPASLSGPSVSFNLPTSHSGAEASERRMPSLPDSSTSSPVAIDPDSKPISSALPSPLRSAKSDTIVEKTSIIGRSPVRAAHRAVPRSGRVPGPTNTVPPEIGLLKRSNSSPYIDRTGLSGERGVAPVPTFSRESKPAARNWVPDRRPVRARFFSPVYGTARSALTGLKNLGNTCFMNAVVQCVNNTPGLSDFFVNEHYQNFINFDNEKSAGLVVQEIAEVIKLMWSGHYRSISMHDMKEVLGRLHQPFRGTNQHDAHEFLMYLLEYLHEDLNEVKHKAPLKEQENDGIPEAKAARLFWDDFTSNNRSFILNMFYGQLKSTVQCTQCQSKSIKFEAFSHISVPMPNKACSSRCTLQECLRLFLTGETIEGWRCSWCKSLVKAVKTLDIWNLPPILVIHIQRFYNDGLWQKKQSAVDFPLTGLDMSEYVINMQSRYRCSEFRLYGVVNHYGSMERGHYTASCWHPRLSRWHKFDDHEVSEMTPSAVHTSSGYILFYSAIDSRL